MKGDLEGTVRPIKPWAASSLYRGRLAQVSMAVLALLDRMLNHHIGMVHWPSWSAHMAAWASGFLPTHSAAVAVSPSACECRHWRVASNGRGYPGGVGVPMRRRADAARHGRAIILAPTPRWPGPLRRLAYRALEPEPHPPERDPSQIPVHEGWGVQPK